MLKEIEKNIREVVYGGMDGAVSTFAVVTGAAGADLGVRVILILGFASVIADGFSMAVGSYLSEESERELFVKKGKRRLLDDDSPLRASTATFVSFLIIGMVPLWVYVIDWVFKLKLSTNVLLAASVASTCLAFTIIGILRARISGSSKLRSVVRASALGLTAATLAYMTGSVLQQVIT